MVFRIELTSRREFLSVLKPQSCLQIYLFVIWIDKAPFAGKNVWKLIIPFPHLVWIWSIDQQAISKPLYYYKVHRQRRIFLPILRRYAIDNFSSSKIAQWKLYSFSFEGLYYLYLALDVSFKEKKICQSGIMRMKCFLLK